MNSRVRAGHAKQADEVLRRFHIKKNQSDFLARKREEFQTRAGTDVVITEDMLVQGALEEWMSNERNTNDQLG